MKQLYFFLSFLVFALLISCGKDAGFKDKFDKEDKWEKESCFELVYPVTYQMPDEAVITGNEIEIKESMEAWYEANPDIEEKPVLIYPVDILFADETTETVDDEEQMILLKEDCKDDEDDLELCEWDEATEASGSEFEKYVVEELVVSEDCECVVSGMEKFLQNGQTRFLIYYKYEDCIGYGYKVICENGDCEDAFKCKFLQDCD